MRHALKLFGLLVVLLLAQQGAVVHELGHVFSVQGAALKTDSRLKTDRSGAAESACAQCPAFAQAMTPAFSHSLQIPIHVFINAQLNSELTIAAIDAALPDPRSRGPPA